MSSSRNSARLVDPDEWSGINLRRCCVGARVLYVDLLNLMQMSGTRGHLDMSPKVNHEGYPQRLSNKVNHEGYPSRLTIEDIHPNVIRDLARHLGFGEDEVWAWLAELLLHGLMELSSEWEIRCPKVAKDEEIRQKRAKGGVLGGNPALMRPASIAAETTSEYTAEPEKVNHEGYPQRLSSKVNLPEDDENPLSLLPSPPSPPLVPPLPPPSHSPLLSPPIIPPRPPQPSSLNPEKKKSKKENFPVSEVMETTEIGTIVPDSPRISYSDDFENAWQLYGRKGSKKLSFPIWKKLSEAQRLAATEHIPRYVKSNDKQFLKDFERYLKAELWESDVVMATDPRRRPKPTPQYSKQTLIDNYELISKLR